MLFFLKEVEIKLFYVNIKYRKYSLLANRIKIDWQLPCSIEKKCLTCILHSYSQYPQCINTVVNGAVSIFRKTLN